MSQGRAILGIGTGWFELEHDSARLRVRHFTDRFNKLGEALQIILPMLAGERPTFEGKYYKTVEAMANPRFRDHIPLMIGGSGEKKTIPLAAKHFDHLNIIAGFDELSRKVDVVKQSCEAIDRDPATLETSMLVMALIDENATADLIPDDFKQRRRLRRRRADRRADRDEGARRRRRQRDPEPDHQSERLPSRRYHRRRKAVETTSRGVIPLLTWERTQPTDAAIGGSGGYRSG